MGRDRVGDWGLKEVDGFWVVGLGRFHFYEFILGKKGGKFKVSVFCEGNVPGIKCSAECSTSYLFDLLYVMIRVGNLNKKSLSVTVRDFGDVYLHNGLRL